MTKADLLEAFADRFLTYASDQRGSMPWQHTAKARKECELKAAVWDDAANELREHAQKELAEEGQSQ